MDQALVVNKSQAPVIPFSDLERMATAFAKSNLFGIKNTDQAIALMLIAQAEGLHPAAAARDYYIVNGKPTLKADSMLARFQQAGGKVVWNAYTDTEVTGTFSHPAGGSATVSWTIAQAKAAGLTGKDVWKQYPRAMLRARVISEGIRTVYPGVSVGVYTPEEVEDFDAKPAPVEVVSEPIVEKPVAAAPTVERDVLFKRLAKSGWAKDDLKFFAGTVYGVSASKDLTDEQLLAFVLTAEAQPFGDAIAAYQDEQL